MRAALRDLLRDCTVLLRGSIGRLEGSGFFVDRNLILTAAHVVERTFGAPEGWWNGLVLSPLEVVWQEPPDNGEDGEYRFPDLALLRVPNGMLDGHPCVALSDAGPGRYLLAEGYTRAVTGGATPDSALLEFESFRYENDTPVIKLKDSIVDKGLSGGPLLDLSSGRVVGVTKGQRTGRLPLGCVAVSVVAIRERDPDLWGSNLRLHQTDRRWEFARLCGEVRVKPATATAACLAMVRGIVARRPVIIPAGAEIRDVHQIPSVRAQRATGHDAKLSAPQVRIGEDVAAHGDALSDGMFRWAPLRARWPVAVLSGMPGAGKSYLLNMHVETLARDSLDRLQAAGGDPMSVPLPVLMDCPRLGSTLPDRVTRESTIDALVETVLSGVDEAPDGVPLQAVDAVLRVAYGDGRLVICLDALDEAGARERQRVLRALTFLTDRGNRLVITSRPHPRLRDDTSKLSGCFRGEVVGFTVGQVFAFARAWFGHDSVMAVRFEAGLRDRPELQALARVPLLAAFLCRLVSEGDNVRALPSSKAKLYEAVVLASLSGHWRDVSMRAIDADNLPDPGLRLRLLISAVGRLTLAWRSRIDRFPVSQLDGALIDHPEYGQANLEATARYAAWHAYQPHPAAPVAQACPVRWEYMFDGLLAYDSADSDGPVVRFAHPVLGEYCIAAYLATLSDSGLRDTIRDHRWFDPSWEQVWTLSAELMASPDQLVRAFLDGPDAWHEQGFLASRCLLGAGNRVSHALMTEVVARVSAAVGSTRPFDRDRGLAYLAELVRAGVPLAIDTARTIMTDAAGERRIRLRAAAVLAETGDEEALGVARVALSDVSVPASYRSWLGRAVVLAEDSVGIAAVTRAIKSATHVIELRLLVEAIPIETTCGADLVAKVLREQAAPVAIRATVGRALIRLGDTRRTEIARDIALDPVTVWNLRAALIAELLAAGDEEVVAAGISVADDPNVSDSYTVMLLESLIRHGQSTILPFAVKRLSRSDVPWWQRKRLAAVIAELGPVGIAELRRQIESALPLDLKLRPIIALVEVGEALDVASRIVSDPGAPSWIRTRLACSLLQIGGTSVNGGILDELVTDPVPKHDFQSELIGAMAGRDLPGAGPAALALLKRRRTAGGPAYLGCRELITALAAAGPSGHEILEQVAENADLAPEDRASAIIELGRTGTPRAGELAKRAMADFSLFIQSRALILLAEQGVLEIADNLTALIDIDAEAYTALYKLLNGARITQDRIEKMLRFGSPRQSKTDDEDGGGSSANIKVDNAFLEECGLSWQSAAERDDLVSSIYNQLQLRVGSKITGFLTSGQLDEFEELTSDEERLEFLRAHASRYSDLVREQVEAIKQEIRGKRWLPDPLPRLPALRRISFIAMVLVQWSDMTMSAGPQGCAQFLVANKDAIVTTEGLMLLDLACRMHQAYNPYEGLYHLVAVALNSGLEASRRFVLDGDHRHNVYCDLLAESNGTGLLFAGLAGTLLAPSEASAYFYAAMGATIADKKALGVSLMQDCHECASDEQKAQGLATLAREAPRLGWNTETLEGLRSTLAGGPDIATDTAS